MQKIEAQHNQAQNQSVQRRGGNAALESPQSEQIAQFEAMAEASPQADKLAQLAAMMDSSPRMAAQRKAAGTIHNSPYVTVQRQRLNSLAVATAQRKEASAKPNNTGLPDNLKNGIESLSGMSMDTVKVHYNSSHPAQLNALAYAQGTDIHVAPGQEQHLPHEAWHVVQQAQGRVKPTMQMKEGVPVNDDKSLEHEADVMGVAALKAGESNTQRKEAAGEITGLYSATYQLLPDVYSTVHFANPEAYIANQYPDKNINEDAGSGGILDEPMRNLVLSLATYESKEEKAGELDEVDSTLASSLRTKVWDRETAHQWVVQNSLQITKKAPSFLTIKRRTSEEEPGGAPHTFHRDHGFVLLSNDNLSAKGITGSNEQTARRSLANGPFNTGWVRGHYGVGNLRHRFIEHIHVDKDKSEEERFEIYNASDKEKGDTAAAFKINDRKDLIEANDGRAAGAATDAEGSAKKLAWETYAGTLPDEY